MQIKTDGDKPIFVQIAEGIEDAVLSGAFMEESQIPSTTEFSINYKINPATALKGMSLLVDEGIIYKKRGLGMFVAMGAVEKLKTKRKSDFFETYITALLEEAKRLQITKEEIQTMIESGFKNELY